MTREELLNSSVYHAEMMRLDLFRQVVKFMKDNKITPIEMAILLGCSHKEMDAILNADYNPTLSRLAEIAVAIGKAPKVIYKTVKED